MLQFGTKRTRRSSARRLRILTGWLSVRIKYDSHHVRSILLQKDFSFRAPTVTKLTVILPRKKKEKRNEKEAVRFPTRKTKKKKKKSHGNFQIHAFREKGHARERVHYTSGQPLMQTLNIKRPCPCPFPSALPLSTEFRNRVDNKPRMLLAIQLHVDDHRFGIFRRD